MKRLYATKFSWLLLVLSLCAAARVFAEDSEVSRRTLKGLAGFYVIVEELQPNLLKYEKYAKQFDLNKAGIQRDVERQLTKAGIRVLSHEEWQKTPGQPVFYVNVNTHESEKYWFSYNIKIEVRQVVSLEANPAVKTFADTWSLSLTGMANIGSLKQISQDINLLTMRFIGVYRGIK
ncbi:MAG: hypothetical protein ACYDH8_02915 [Syntrophales bacterium]